MEKRINSIASYLFISLIFITPLIFSVSDLFTFQFSKILPFFFILFAVAFLYIITIFNDGKVALPWHWFFVVAAFVPFIYIVSSLTSINPSFSLLGTGTEIGTASTIVGLFIFMYLVSFFMRSKDKSFISYMAFAVAFLLLGIFHVLRFVLGADFLSFGIFTNIISNTIGRFSDLALIAGAAVLLSLTSIEFLRLGKLVRVISYIMLTLSLIILAVTNFPLVLFGVDPGSSISIFTLIGFFALIFFVYFVSSSYGSATTSSRRIPIASLVVLVVSIVFTLGAIPLQNVISSFLKIESTNETRLLWKSTVDLSGSTISQFSVRPFLGYGPEQFSYKWMLDKPREINDSVFWNSTFAYGVGFIPSAVVTVGLLGFLGWAAFLGLLGWLGFRALFMKNKDPFSHYILVSSFLVSVYLWIAAIAYIPSLTTFIMTFFFTGIFLASLFREKIFNEKEVVFEQSKAKSFAFILGLIFILIVILLWGYKIGERAVASMYATKADVVLANAKSTEDIDKAKAYIRSAGSLANESFYSRSLSIIALAQVNAILQNKDLPADTLRQQFSTTYQEAMAYAQNAVSLDPLSFDNQVTYGNVLATAVPLGSEGYYEGAKTTYEAAARLNPNNPLIPYLIAQLEVGNNDFDAAKVQIGQALTLKSNYVEAIILLGSIQINEGDTADALNSFLAAQSLQPQNEEIKNVINSLRRGNAATSTSSN